MVVLYRQNNFKIPFNVKRVIEIRPRIFPFVHQLHAGKTAVLD